MEVLGLTREEACWYTPMVVIRRMQKAYLERQGDEQSWSKSGLDKMMEQQHGGNSTTKG